MPSCPECGIDVEVAGLCPECQARRERSDRRASNTGSSKDAGAKRWPLILAVIVVVLVVFGAAFYLGRLSLEGSGAPQSADPSAAAETSASESSLSETASNPVPSETVPAESPVFDVRSIPAGPPFGSEDEYLRWMLDNTDQKEEMLRAKWVRFRWIMSWSRSPGLTHDRVTQAFLRTPREYFCREWNIDRAYDHAYLAIGYGQTISGPEIVTRMTNALNPQPDHKVLEIGTGSGYQSAFLAEISNHVYTIEIVKELAESTDEIYLAWEDKYPQYGNIMRKVDDGYYGWEEHAPFDRIIVTCGIDHIPPSLLKQLVPGGIMVIPVGPPSGQSILKVTKKVEADGAVVLEREDIYQGTPITTDIFVPFTSKDGGTHSQADP